MDYFFFCRDREGSAELRGQLVEAHWTFMDDYESRMTARGPTLTDDGRTATGSMHIVDLADEAEARAFAYTEPNYLAGVYGEVQIWRWRNALARTMWDVERDPTNLGHLVIAHGWQAMATDDGDLQAAHHARMTAPSADGQLVVCGSLLSDDGSAWLGDTLIVETPSRADVDALLARDPCALAGLYRHVKIHRWERGGRR